MSGKMQKRKLWLQRAIIRSNGRFFGQGALRISSRELFFEIQEMSRSIDKKMKRIREEMPKSKLNLDSDTIRQLEKWRRGEK
ncbi:hypothetical protein MCOL2_19549 [Listeria fleischmannii FSL S10-1203]|uniref:Uncharacterized protein n=1 Tax=Listeria fleischmannii FSL S10-1203 TaxID=1265822 RepID=W7DHL7_9LIST|nr:hypothetical protein MCOL2_19549 [Listeria fleischmannii FSL S10-1203]